MTRVTLNLDNKALKVNKLTKKYFHKSQNKKIFALDEVTFSIEKGSMIALLGPNGAGKSTLINILAGITNKSSGKAFINGFDLDKAVNEAKAGQVEIRNDKDGNIGLSIGKKSFEDQKLIKNYNAVIDALEKEKSNLTIKVDLVKQVFVTSSMGVSYKVKMGNSK